MNENIDDPVKDLFNRVHPQQYTELYVDHSK